MSDHALVFGARKLAEALLAEREAEIAALKSGGEQ